MDPRRSGPAERHHRPEPPTGAHPSAVDVPSAPYLRRPGDGPLPDGWRAEPVRGGWKGLDTEVVYDPRRHEIAFTWHSQRTRRRRVVDVIYNHRDQEALVIPHDEDTDPADLMTALGWEQRAIDGQRSFWTGDRHAAVEAALRRIDQPATPTTTPGQHDESPQAIATKPTGGDLTL
jgi:hypothetical protein